MPVMQNAGRGRSAVTVAWGLMAAASAALVWAAARLHIDVGPIAPDRVVPEATTFRAGNVPSALPPPVVPQPIDAYRATLERPLFEATRRPRPAPDAPPAEAADAREVLAEELRIVGIMRPRKGSSTARVLVRSADAPQGVWVEEGASIAGWTVSQIGDRTIKVEAGRQRREISLFPTVAKSAN